MHTTRHTHHTHDTCLCAIHTNSQQEDLPGTHSNGEKAIQQTASSATLTDFQDPLFMLITQEQHAAQQGTHVPCPGLRCVPWLLLWRSSASLGTAHLSEARTERDKEREGGRKQGQEGEVKRCTCPTAGDSTAAPPYLREASARARVDKQGKTMATGNKHPTP